MKKLKPIKNRTDFNLEKQKQIKNRTDSKSPDWTPLASWYCHQTYQTLQQLLWKLALPQAASQGRYSTAQPPVSGLTRISQTPQLLLPANRNVSHLLPPSTCPTRCSSWRQMPSSPVKCGRDISTPPSKAAGLVSAIERTPRPPCLTGWRTKDCWKLLSRRKETSGTFRTHSTPRPLSHLGMCSWVANWRVSQRMVSRPTAASLMSEG